MILNENIEIKVSAIHVNKLKKYYPDIEIGQNLTIKVSELSKNSHIKIEVLCDLCGKSKKLSYSKYNKNIENCGYYSCSQKCSAYKNKMTYFNKTGFTHQMLNQEIKDKIKKTNLEKYGVEHPKKNIEVRKKSIETCLRNNGVEYGFLLFDKCKESLKYLYGVDNPMKNEKIKNKVFETNILKYGVKTSLLNTDVRKKSTDKMIELFGTSHALQNSEIMDKMIRNSLKFKKHEIGILYQGSYEKDFLDICVEKNIEVERGLTIKYMMGDKNLVYFSDFFIPKLNLVVEIKSTWIWQKHEEKNIKKAEEVINNGYNYILILDKKYDDFFKIINENC
jgi:hypothetical protein